ncbi:MAG: hypothetical protein V4443_06750 [Pseudomonadota bacterium]
MLTPSRALTVFSVLIALLLSACATTQLTSAWKDPGYNSHPRKVMVVAVAKNPINRRVFEDEFVRQLRTRGTDAFASYTVVPDASQNNQAVIAQKMKEQGADAMLITRMVSRKTVKTYVPGTVYIPPPSYSRWGDYYGTGYAAIQTPGYVAENEYAVMESNLYDARNDKLIWAVSSETGTEGSNQSQIQTYVKIMVENLGKQGLLGAQ